ncbi:MAG: regulatory protein RecX [Halieaceae bacterium]|nr:regulatory protein RecX [Halieaceae bacterium]
MKEFSANDIRLQAMNLLSRREHLRQELMLKLGKRFGVDAGAEIADVLDDLAAENLLSDLRFTESYIRQRVGKGYGPDRIRQELRNKGVDTEQIELALDEAEVDWVQRAAEVRLKKFGATPPSDFKEKARQLRFLNYRGFSGEFAGAALDFEPQADSF